MKTTLAEWREHIHLLRAEPSIAMNHDDLLWFVDELEKEQHQLEVARQYIKSLEAALALSGSEREQELERERDSYAAQYDEVVKEAGALLEREQELTNALAWAETFLARHDAFMQSQTPANAYAMRDAADGLRDALAALAPAVEDSEAMRLLRIRHVEEIEALRRNEERWDHRAPAVEERCMARHGMTYCNLAAGHATPHEYGPAVEEKR